MHAAFRWMDWVAFRHPCFRALYPAAQNGSNGGWVTSALQTARVLRAVALSEAWPRPRVNHGDAKMLPAATAGFHVEAVYAGTNQCSTPGREMAGLPPRRANTVPMPPLLVDPWPRASERPSARASLNADAPFPVAGKEIVSALCPSPQARGPINPPRFCSSRQSDPRACCTQIGPLYDYERTSPQKAGGSAD